MDYRRQVDATGFWHSDRIGVQQAAYDAWGDSRASHDAGFASEHLGCQNGHMLGQRVAQECQAAAAARPPQIRLLQKASTCHVILQATLPAIAYIYLRNIQGNVQSPSLMI